MTDKLGRLQQHLWETDPQWFGWRSRVANGISGFRYWLWFLTGGWRA